VVVVVVDAVVGFTVINTEKNTLKFSRPVKSNGELQVLVNRLTKLDDQL